MGEGMKVSGAEFVREVEGGNMGACLVRVGGDYFMVSSANVPFGGPETLVFACDENGEVESWLEVAGGKGMSREDVIADLVAGQGDNQ